VQLAVQPIPDLSDGARRVVGIGEIDLDVVFGPCFPRAVLRKRMARAGDHAPAGGGEAFDRRMADPAARSREEQRAARLVCLRTGHAIPEMVLLCDRQVDASLRVEPRLVPRRIRAVAFELEAIVQSKRALLPEFYR